MNKLALIAVFILSVPMSSQAWATDSNFGQLFTNEAPPALGGRDPLAGTADIAGSTTDTDFFNIEPAAGEEASEEATEDMVGETNLENPSAAQQTGQGIQDSVQDSVE